MKRTIALLAGLALVLLAGCGDKLPSDIPDVIGYNGLVAEGWEAYDQGDYSTAMEKFQEAIGVDVTRPDAYLGAGWSSVHLSDYWNVGGDYFFMTAQNDCGSWPIATNAATIQQDIDWTVFECIDPILSESTMSVIEAYGETWEGWPTDTSTTYIDNQIIGAFLYGASPFNADHNDPQSPKYGAIAFKYRYEPEITDFFAMTSAVNEWSLNENIRVDSLVNNNGQVSVYLNVPYRQYTAEGTNYRTWIMATNDVRFDYSTYNLPAAATDFTRNAMTGYAALQMAKGLSGDMIAGLTAAFGVYDGGDYAFEHSGMNRNNVLGMAAAMTFLQQEFRFTLFEVQYGGFGLDIAIDDPDFVIELAQTIEGMLQN